MDRTLKLFLIELLIACLLLCGCNAKPTDQTGTSTDKDMAFSTTERPDDGHTVVGISMPDRLLERWNNDGAFLRDHFEGAGCEVILSYANNLIDKQISDVRDMISQGADFLVITAVDGAAISKPLEEAKALGIKVIAYDRLIMGTDAVDYYVSFDNYKVGVLQANYIIASLGLKSSTEPKTIEFITGDPVDNNAKYFYQGAMDTLKPFLDSGQLLVPSGQSDFYETATAQWSTDIAQQRLQIILSSYYPKNMRLDAVLCANDSTALGATKAIASDYQGLNNVIITGQDGDIPNIYNIIYGSQSMTVYKHLPQEAIVTLSIGLDILSGNAPSEDLIAKSHWDFDCSYDVETYNNGNKAVPSYLLRPIAISADNIEKELFDSGYYNRDSTGQIYITK